MIKFKSIFYQIIYCFNRVFTHYFHSFLVTKPGTGIKSVYFDNGFIVFECPELAADLTRRFADQVAAGKRTVKGTMCGREIDREVNWKKSEG